MKKFAVGIVGSGVISAAYLKAAQHFPEINIVSCSDVVPASAEARAEEFGIRARPVEALFEDANLDLILNLTPPKNHAEVSRKALQSGKHVYSEKPLALSVAESKTILNLAGQQQRRVGCAPDTFLGGGQQTVRGLIDAGAIGTPIGGHATIMLPGHERWHPNPRFYYQEGGGPVFDMGPYYITALVNLLGPVKRVFAFGRKTFPSRKIFTGPEQGKEFPVEIQSHFVALLEFDNEVAVTFSASFDVEGHSQGPIEIYGTEGTIQAPDPNHFGGPVRLLRKGEKWVDLALTHGYADRNYRILGAAEMARAIAANLPHRASLDLAFHVLEVLEAIVVSGANRQVVEIGSRCPRPRSLTPLAQMGDLA